MSYYKINVGKSPNDRSGDSLRSAFIKINQNFDDIQSTLFALTGSDNNTVPVNTNIKGSVYANNGNLVIDAEQGQIVESAIPEIIPRVYKLTARFNAVGDLTVIDDVPEGWTIVTSGNIARIFHPLNKLPIMISYWGKRANGEYRFRYPTPGYPASVSPEIEFRIELLLTAVATGAEENQLATITIMI
jgi:hypothetical protein